MATQKVENPFGIVNQVTIPANKALKQRVV